MNKIIKWVRKNAQISFDASDLIIEEKMKTETTILAGLKNRLKGWKVTIVPSK